MLVGPAELQCSRTGPPRLEFEKGVSGDGGVDSPAEKNNSLIVKAFEPRDDISRICSPRDPPPITIFHRVLDQSLSSMISSFLAVCGTESRMPGHQSTTQAADR